MKILLLSVTISLSLVACGSSQNPGEVVTTYSDAVASQNWEGVCEQISAESIQSVLRESGEKTCPEAYRALPEAGQNTLQRSAQGAEFVSEDIEGDQGTVTLRTDSGTAKVPVIREDGKWRVHLFRD